MAKRKNKQKKKGLDKIRIRSLIIIIAVLVVLVAVSFFGLKVINIFDFEEETENPNQSEFVDYTDVGEEAHIEALNELRNADNLSTLLKEWAVTSDENTLMRSKDVINFLLIGVDKEGANSDVIMLLSLNTKTQKIFLSSLFRDSYTYISGLYGDKYAKINAAYSNGGAKKLVETVQNDYKIKIDYYVSVNFDSFVGVVDAMEGITLNVKPHEAREIENEIGKGCPVGDNVTLNGLQALTYCRIRKCDADSDVSRTRRQREFITAVINRAKDINIYQINTALNTLLKYVKTDCSTSKLLSLSTQAVANKWYNYEIVSDSYPEVEDRLDYRGNAWVWIVDYPSAAKKLHEKIYGTSNIILNNERTTAIDIMKRGSSGEANP